MTSQGVREVTVLRQRSVLEWYFDETRVMARVVSTSFWVMAHSVGNCSPGVSIHYGGECMGAFDGFPDTSTPEGIDSMFSSEGLSLIKASPIRDWYVGATAELQKYFSEHGIQ